jgi:hypothetical protein
MSLPFRDVTVCNVLREKVAGKMGGTGTRYANPLPHFLYATGKPQGLRNTSYARRQREPPSFA